MFRASTMLGRDSKPLRGAVPCSSTLRTRVPSVYMTCSAVSKVIAKIELTAVCGSCGPANLWDIVRPVTRILAPHKTRTSGTRRRSKFPSNPKSMLTSTIQCCLIERQTMSSLTQFPWDNIRCALITTGSISLRRPVERAKRASTPWELLTRAAA